MRGRGEAPQKLNTYFIGVFPIGYTPGESDKISPLWSTQMKALLLCTVTLLLFTPAITNAQPNPVCDPAKTIDEASKMKSSGDAIQDMKALIALQQEISAQRLACSDLKFAGKNQKVIGPLELPLGTYRVTFKTEGYVILTMEPLEGDCDKEFLLNLSEGEAQEGAEAFIKLSSPCKVIFPMDNITASWELIITPIN